jgi:hypothetical protein
VAILVLVESADHIVGGGAVLTGVATSLAKDGAEKKIRKVARRFNFSRGLMDKGYSEFKTIFWTIICVKVTPTEPQSRFGECVILIRRSPMTWIQRKLGLQFRNLAKYVSEALPEAGYNYDQHVIKVLKQLS